MPGHSNKTEVVAARLPNEVIVVITRRAEKQRLKPSEYIKQLISYDTLRKR